MPDYTIRVARPQTYHVPSSFDVKNKTNDIGKNCIGIDNVSDILKLRVEQQKSAHQLVPALMRAINEGSTSYTEIFSTNASPADTQAAESQPNVSIAHQLDSALKSLPSSVEFLTGKKDAAFKDLLIDVKNKHVLKNDESAINKFVTMLSSSNSVRHNSRALDCVNDFLMMRKEIKDSSPALSDDQKIHLNKLTGDFIKTVAKDGLGLNSYAAGSSKGNGSGTKALDKFNNICDQLATMKEAAGQSTLSFNRELADTFKIALSKIEPPEAREKIMKQAEDFIFRPSLKEHGMMHATILSDNSGLGAFYTKQIQLGHEALILDLLKNELLDSVNQVPPGPQRSTAVPQGNITIHLDNSFHLHNSPLNKMPAETPSVPVPSSVVKSEFAPAKGSQTGIPRGVDQGTQGQLVRVGQTESGDTVDSGTMFDAQNALYPGKQVRYAALVQTDATKAKTVSSIPVTPTAESDEMLDAQNALYPGKQVRYAALVQTDATKAKTVSSIPVTPTAELDAMFDAQDALYPGKQVRYAEHIRTNEVPELVEVKKRGSIPVTSTVDSGAMVDARDALRAGRPVRYAEHVQTDITAVQSKHAQNVTEISSKQAKVISGEGLDRWGKRSYIQMQKDNATYRGSPGSAQAPDKFAEVGKSLQTKSREAPTVVKRQSNLYQEMPRPISVTPQDKPETQTEQWPAKKQPDPIAPIVASDTERSEQPAEIGLDRWGKRSFTEMKKEDRGYIGGRGSAQALPAFDTKASSAVKK